MGLYREQVVPRLVDLACGSAGFDRWRARRSRGLAGRVVEIGFGSGLQRAPLPARRRRGAWRWNRRRWPGGWPSSDRGLPGARRARRSRWPADPARRRVVRRGALHVHPVHHARSGAGALRATAGGATRGHGPLSGARAVSRSRCRQVAASHRTGATPARRRVPPHPGPDRTGGASRVRHGAKRAALRTRPQTLVLDHSRRSPPNRWT